MQPRTLVDCTQQTGGLARGMTCVQYGRPYRLGAFLVKLARIDGLTRLSTLRAIRYRTFSQSWAFRPRSQIAVSTQAIARMGSARSPRAMVMRNSLSQTRS